MITGIFGLPGSGKSTFLAQLAKRYQKMGYRVFINEDFPVDGCYLYSWSDVGKFDMSNSVVLIDEVSLYADNRDFKQFHKALKQFFILHRHYHIDIVWCTQQFDGVDRKIRELTSQLYYVSPFLFGFSKITALQKIQYIPTKRDLKNNPTAEPHQALVRIGLLKILTSPISRSFWKAVKLCYKPRYFRYFDSFTAPELPYKDYPLYQTDPSLGSKGEPL